MCAYENRRFPCKELKYAKTVGELLLSVLKEIFEELGFRAETFPLQRNGADIQVYLGDNLVLVAEVLNWSIGSRLTDRRKYNIIRNLNQHNCNKVLIYTIPISNTSSLEENGIHLLKIGFQILPVTYYIFFFAKKQVKKRWIDCDATRKRIRSKILDYVNNHLFGHKYLKFLFS